MATYLGSTTANNFYLGSTPVTGLYLGSNQIWPTVVPVPYTGSFIIGGVRIDQTDLENALTGETLNNYRTSSVTDPAFTYATSSTSYQINVAAFGPTSNILGVTEYLDYGACNEIKSSAFDFVPGLVNIYFASASIINENAFSSCGVLVTANLPAAIVLGGNAFGANTRLKFLTIPNVKTVGQNCFDGCQNLDLISLPSLSGSNALGGSPLSNNVFSGVSNTGSITVPSYLSASNGGNLDGDLQDLQVPPKTWTINWI
jgi:hypothetical protein